MPTDALKFDAKVTSFRRAKDGIVISLVIHPESNCIAALAVLPVGWECGVELGAPNDGPTESRPVAEATDRKAEGSQSGSVAGRVLTPADRAVKMAHTYAAGDEEILQGIRDYCGVKSCAEFKTNPGAVKRFHDWEYIQGFRQDRP